MIGKSGNVRILNWNKESLKHQKPFQNNTSFRLSLQKRRYDTLQDGGYDTSGEHDIRGTDMLKYADI